MSRILFSSDLKIGYLKRTDIGEALVSSFLEQQLKQSSKLNDLIEENTIYDILKKDLSTIEKTDLVYRYIPLDRNPSERFKKAVILAKLSENIMNSINEKKILDSDDLLYRLIESFKNGSIEQFEDILDSTVKTREERKLLFFAAHLTMHDKDLNRILENFQNFSEKRIELYKEIEDIARRKIPSDMIPFKKSEIIHLVNHIFDNVLENSNLSDRILQLYDDYKKVAKKQPVEVKVADEPIKITPDNIDQFVEENSGISSDVVFDSVTMFDLIEKIAEKGKYNFYVRGHITYLNLPEKTDISSYSWYKSIGGIYSKNIVHSSKELENMSRFLQSITYNGCLNIYTLKQLHDLYSIKNSFIKMFEQNSYNTSEAESLYENIQHIYQNFKDIFTNYFYQQFSYNSRNERYINESLEEFLEQAARFKSYMDSVSKNTYMDSVSKNIEPLNYIINNIRDRLLFLDRIDFSFPEIVGIVDKYNNIPPYYRQVHFQFYNQHEQYNVYTSNTLLLLPEFKHTINNFFLTKTELQKLNRLYDSSISEKEVLYNGFTVVGSRKNPYFRNNIYVNDKSYLDIIQSGLEQNSFTQPLLLNSLFTVFDTHINYYLETAKKEIIKSLDNVTLLPSIIESLQDNKKHLTYLNIQDVKKFSRNCLNSNLSSIKDKLTIKQERENSEIQR